MMDPTIEAYNKIGEDYKRINAESIWASELGEFKRRFKGRKIIEIGCGSGRDAAYFIGQGYDDVGIDGSQKLIEICNQTLSRGNFQLMDFYQLVFPDDSFDGFLAIASLLHAPKDRVSEVLSSIRRVVKPNGLGFVAMREGEGFRDKGGVKRYFSFYTLEGFAGVLTRTGFSVDSQGRTKEPDGTPWVYYFVKNLK